MLRLLLVRQPEILPVLVPRTYACVTRQPDSSPASGKNALETAENPQHPRVGLFYAGIFALRHDSELRRTR